MIHLWGIWELGSLQLNRLLETLDQGRQTLSVEPVGRASCPQTLWQAIASNTCWICEKKVLLGEQDKFLSWADSGKPTMETMPSEWVTNNSFKFQVQVTLNSLASPCPMPSPDLLSYLPIMLAWFLPLHLFLGLISSEGTFQDSPPLLTLLSQASPWSPCWTFSSTIWLNHFPASASKWSSVHTPWPDGDISCHHFLSQKLQCQAQTYLIALCFTNVLSLLWHMGSAWPQGHYATLQFWKLGRLKLPGDLAEMRCTNWVTLRYRGDSVACWPSTKLGLERKAVENPRVPTPCSCAAVGKAPPRPLPEVSW